MRIAVFEVGGVGGYFGGRLAQAGEEVTSTHGMHSMSRNLCGYSHDVDSGSFQDARRALLDAECTNSKP
jgi:2-dehydropantoate 2-reductase